MWPSRRCAPYDPQNNKKKSPSNPADAARAELALYMCEPCRKLLALDDRGSMVVSMTHGSDQEHLRDGKGQAFCVGSHGGN